MKIENVEIPSILKFCPVEILLSQSIAGVEKSVNFHEVPSIAYRTVENQYISSLCDLIC
jgi:hypothetical protein